MVKEKINWREVHANCPEGYTVNGGEAINMLGTSELWRIFEHHAEPHLARIPQDLIDDGNGTPCAGHVPKAWGRVLYYKVV
jgi:hypothetical protein